MPSRTAARIFTRGHILWYRMTGGLIGARAGRIRMLLLTTTGRKTGRRYTTPLSYLRDGENMVVVASFGGSPTHPVWYLNLQSHPRATVQAGWRTLDVDAETANPEERARLWPLVVQMYGGYEGYQKRTKREIPLVILKPVAG
jgi:deazaflavin-dependent oxidoreductase (nitroreductase family)